MHPCFKDITGERYGRLVVVALAGSAKGYAMWRCRCDCGNEKVVRGTTLRTGATQSCGCLRVDVLREHPAHFKGDDIGYTAAHWRVRKARGNASEHECESCGELAEEWALGADAGLPMFDARGIPYSPNPEAYRPLCVKCHRHYDMHPWCNRKAAA